MTASASNLNRQYSTSKDVLRSTFVLTLIVVGELVTLGQQPARLAREYRQANEHRILAEFVQLLTIPNVAADTVNIQKNASFILNMMRVRGLDPRLLKADDPAAPPAIFGEWSTPGATRTIVFYAHYDGQPADPKQWTGSGPWQPIIRSAPLEAGGKRITSPLRTTRVDGSWRLYARSASDDKAGVVALLTAFSALRDKGLSFTSNIKFFFDGEEEAGSPHLGEIIQRHRNLLEADAWIVCDGPVHQSGSKQVVFGVRGDTNVDLTVYGPKRPLHSGHYGNWSPNPALILARLLGSMKDDAGRVTISGWYDGVEPLSELERRAIAEAPENDADLKRALGLTRTDGNGRRLLELINEPSLNINGLSSGDVGDLARNIIPTTATAVLDLRTVKGSDYLKQVERLIDHIRKQGFYVTNTSPNDDERQRYPRIARVVHRAGGYNASRTGMDLPISGKVIEAVQSTSPHPIVKLPTSGGSLPLSLISENLNVPTIIVPIANYDNNQHAENENIRIQNLWDGIEIYAALMTMNK